MRNKNGMGTGFVLEFMAIHNTYCYVRDSQMPVHVTVMEVLDITQFNSSKRDTLTSSDQAFIRYCLT